jgi:hypothetical protein
VLEVDPAGLVGGGVARRRPDTTERYHRKWRISRRRRPFNRLAPW